MGYHNMEKEVMKCVMENNMLDNIANIATGYELKDIIIKATTKKLQRNAIQQNCVAKVHSYWLVLKLKESDK
jgi:hypothetical protein